MAWLGRGSWMTLLHTGAYSKKLEVVMPLIPFLISEIV